LFADDKPFSFEAALQSHVSVRQIEQAQAMGLFGKLVLDCDSDPDKPWLHTANDHNTTFGGRASKCDTVCIPKSEL
jgi:hypothetical protein